MTVNAAVVPDTVAKACIIVASGLDGQYFVDMNQACRFD